ncbi:MAG: diguanylate cyclase [Acidobacteria bacterium]|jgi:diguanylate cyclase (GGDEF)-like protein/PAS domain S-box-containing protein|nr:diguanylate cyclase [Acidobacteriota bacterium]
MNDDGFYRKLLDNLFDGVYLVDREGRITYWNRGAEELAGFPASQVVGTHCWDNKMMHVDAAGTQLCAGGCPLAATMEDGCPREAEVFMRHQLGHRVPVSLRVSPVRNGGGQITGAVEVFRDNSAKNAAEDKIVQLEGLALLDPLTGVGNRRNVEIRLQASLAAFQRYGWAFGVLFLDVDRLKKVNDTAGYEAGDQVLRMVARTMAASLRPMDSFGRWGGEEFVAVVTNTTKDGLRVVAERCRRLVEQSALEAGPGRIRVTVSAGGSMARAGDTAESLIERADRLMCRAKTGGRNRAEFEEMAGADR